MYVTPIKHRVPIEVSFTASLPQEFNFNLECRVKRKPSLLRLNVKAGGYSVRMGLSFTGPNGEELEVPIQSKTNRTISFGRVCNKINILRMLCSCCLYLSSPL